MLLTADLGGTHMRAARVDADGKLSDRLDRPTPIADPAPTAFVELLKEAAAGCDRAVIGLPVRIDFVSGAIAHGPNLPRTWLPHLTRDALTAALGLPVALSNDADLAAIGEGYFGAGVGFDDIVFLTFSTGIGGGVLLGRKLVRGRNSLAEVGHCVIDLAAASRGAPCTSEGLASGTALGRLGQQAGISGGGAEIVRRMEAGEPVARGVFERVAFAAAVTVQNAAFTFSPQVVIIGGGLGLVGEPFLGPIRARLAKAGPPGLEVKVVNAGLGADAGLIGTAAWDRASA